jgi:exopolyphosphatase/guanosine-5'-triphosphate,3'-diphosphate pyrophosphatase
MKNNIAIIDLGSNLTKLVVVSGKLPLQVIHRSVYDTKTLKSAPKGVFDSVSIERIETDISKVLDVANSLDCATILGIATSAFRTRKNGKEVISSINKKFGTNIEIIEGEREAQLIYKGALASVTPKQFPVLVMDIGGGSTEFIIGTETEISWKHSFDFGSTALTKGMEISDPISSQECIVLDEKLANFLPAFFEAFKEFKPVSFIGTTGAFESFAQLTENAKGNNIPVESGYEYELPELVAIINKLINSTAKERTQMDGMNLLRVPTINIAALILNHVLALTNYDNYYLSLGDVKEGLALEFLENCRNITR